MGGHDAWVAQQRFLAGLTEIDVQNARVARVPVGAPPAGAAIAGAAPPGGRAPPTPYSSAAAESPGDEAEPWRALPRDPRRAAAGATAARAPPANAPLGVVNLTVTKADDARKSRGASIGRTPPPVPSNGCDHAAVLFNECTLTTFFSLFDCTSADAQQYT